METRKIFCTVLLACCLLFALVAVPCALGSPVGREWRQAKLNQSLYAAVKKNNATSVRSLLQAGAEANYRLPLSSSALLQRSSSYSHRKTATRSHGPSLLCVALDTPVPPDHTSHMPLWYPPDCTAVVQFLVDAGADVQRRTAQGESPLLLAVRYRHSQAAVQALLRAGANVNAQDHNGWTPLIWAVYESEPQTVRLLLAHHADPNRGARQEYARNALSIASHPEIIKMLRQVGAKE